MEKSHYPEASEARSKTEPSKRESQEVRESGFVLSNISQEALTALGEVTGSLKTSLDSKGRPIVVFQTNERYEFRGTRENGEQFRSQKPIQFSANTAKIDLVASPLGMNKNHEGRRYSFQMTDKDGTVSKFSVFPKGASEDAKLNDELNTAKPDTQSNKTPSEEKKISLNPSNLPSESVRNELVWIDSYGALRFGRSARNEHEQKFVNTVVSASIGEKESLWVVPYLKREQNQEKAPTMQEGTQKQSDKITPQPQYRNGQIMTDVPEVVRYIPKERISSFSGNNASGINVLSRSGLELMSTGIIRNGASRESLLKLDSNIVDSVHFSSGKNRGEILMATRMKGGGNSFFILNPFSQDPNSRAMEISQRVYLQRNSDNGNKSHYEGAVSHGTVQNIGDGAHTNIGGKTWGNRK